MYLMPDQVRLLLTLALLALISVGCGSARRIAERSAGSVIAHEVDRKLDEHERGQARERRAKAPAKEQRRGEPDAQPPEAP